MLTKDKYQMLLPRPESVTINNVDDKIQGKLDSAFPHAAAALGYANLVVKIHSVKRMPKAIFEKAEFPALKFKIVSAQRNTRQEKALQEA